MSSAIQQYGTKIAFKIREEDQISPEFIFIRFILTDIHTKFHQLLLFSGFSVFV